MKESVCSIAGVIGSVIAGAFGGWDAALATLLIFMGIDYITGLMVAIACKSVKTKNGSLSSYIGWIGLMKKCSVLLLVMVAVRLDIMVGANYIRDGVCIAFATNELISIVENAGILGVPIPSIFKKVIDILKNRKDDDKNGND